MALRDEVDRETAGQDGWRREMALALASEVDAKGTAAAAKELRSLLSEMGVGSGAGAVEKETGLSEFERRLAEREAKAPRRASGE